MKLHNYAQALSDLPTNYSGRHVDEVSICMFDGRIIISHPEEIACVYCNGEWSQMVLTNEVYGAIPGADLLPDIRRLQAISKKV